MQFSGRVLGAICKDRKREGIGEQVEHFVSGDKKATGDDPEWTSPLSFHSELQRKSLQQIKLACGQ